MPCAVPQEKHKIRIESRSVVDCPEARRDNEWMVNRCEQIEHPLRFWDTVTSAFVSKVKQHQTAIYADAFMGKRCLP